ncbi:hypothetical protein ACUHMQ_14250 [Chitinimonas sp. PSY-7]|uniref:hypothetical protein n=1 Tax=Chitinimonas sp. PSY-7 TaxID=3459088 RepID=UPI0040400541
MQRKIHYPVLVLTGVLTAALGGCGGGDSTTTTTTTPPTAATNVTVSPSLGKFSSGTPVRALTLAGAVLGTGTIDANGTSILNIGSHTGPYVVEVTGNGTATYFDEAAGTNVVFPNGSTLTAVAPAGTTAVGVTPLSDAAKRQLEAASGGLAAASTTSIQQANATIAAAFGLGDVLAPPTLVGSGSAGTLKDSTADRYALVLAGIANSGATGVAVHDIAKFLARDLADGKLDGVPLPTDTAPMTGVVINDFITNFTTKLRKAADDFADDATRERVHNEEVVLNPVPTPVDTSLAAGIAAARKMLRDVRVSVSLANAQLHHTGAGLSEAVHKVNDLGRLSLEHFHMLKEGFDFLRDLRAENTTGATQNPNLNNRWEKEFTSGVMKMRCRSDVADAKNVAEVKCTYANGQGRNPANATEWSRFAFTVKRGTADGLASWDAYKEFSADGSYADPNYTKRAFGTDQDGTLSYSKSGAAEKYAVKGDMPYGMLVEDKQTLDIAVTRTEVVDNSGNASGTGSVVGTATRTVGDKKAQLEILDGSQVSYRESDEMAFGTLKVKATVGQYGISGDLTLGDPIVLPATGNFTGSIGVIGVSVAEVVASVTRKAIDPVHELDAGTISATAKVTTASGTVVQLAVGLEREQAGIDTVKLSSTHKVGDRSVTLGATLVNGHLSDTATISNAEGVTVTLTRGTDGKLIGKVKKGEQEVGTIADEKVNFKDGSTETLG